MTATIDPEYSIDTRQIDYREPQSEVARLVQMPSYLIDGYSLADAYMRDAREAQRAGRKALEDRGCACGQTVDNPG